MGLVAQVIGGAMLGAVVAGLFGLMVGIMGLRDGLVSMGIVVTITAWVAAGAFLVAGGN